MVENSLKKFLNPRWTDPLSLKNIESLVKVSNELTALEVIELALNPDFRHVVQTSSLFFKDEVNAAAEMIRSPNSFLKSPLRCLLPSACSSEEELRGFEFEFNTNGQKLEMIEKFEKYCRTISDSEAFLQNSNLIADELFTNAIYNAPFNDAENTCPGRKRGSEEIAMPSKKSGRIFSGRHQNRFIIGCEDPFGTLNIKRNFERIKACLVNGATDMIQFGEGGAGLGSYLIYTSSVSLYVGVKKGEKTVVCSLLPLGVGDLKRNEMPKSIHYLDL
jgi:hypothetical protein